MVVTEAIIVVKTTIIETVLALLAVMGLPEIVIVGAANSSRAGTANRTEQARITDTTTTTVKAAPTPNKTAGPSHLHFTAGNPPVHTLQLSYFTYSFRFGSA